MLVIRYSLKPFLSVSTLEVILIIRCAINCHKLR